MFRYEHYKSIELPVYTDRIKYMDECVTECLLALDEGFTNPIYIIESSSYLTDMMFESLESVKKILLDVYNKVIEYLTNYIVNSLSALKKMRGRIMAIDDDRLGKVVYKTYAYGKLYTLPVKIKKDIPVIDRDNEFRKVLKSDRIEQINFSEEVNKKIDSFVSEVLDVKFRSTGNLTKDVSSKCYELMRGNEKPVKLDKKTLDRIIDEILDFKDLKKEIMANKSEMLEYYERLKTAMLKTYETKTDDGKTIRSLYDKNLSNLSEMETNNLTFGSVEANRLYSAYIQVYQTIFNCKMNIMKDRLNSNKKLINDLLKIISLPEGLRVSDSEINKDFKLEY